MKTTTLKLLILLFISILIISFTSCEKDQNEDSSSGNSLVKDGDNNIYHTVQISHQLWMTENLKATKYNDGTPIQLIQNNEDWENTAIGAYSWFNNDITYKDAYGALYNWHVVETGKLCPDGWRVPTREDWVQLMYYIDGNADGEMSNAGHKLKSLRTEPDTHPRWTSPNTGATDLYGFAALPGGYRNELGEFLNIGQKARFWSSTAETECCAWFVELFHNSNYFLQGDFYRKDGLSVRCIKGDPLSYSENTDEGLEEDESADDEAENTLTDGHLRLEVYRSNLNTLIKMDQWNYIVVTKSSDLNGKLFVNGELAHTENWQNVDYVYNKLLIGASYYTSYRNFFSGHLDDLRVSSTIRSEEEIKSHYNSNKPFEVDDSTIGLWNFDQRTGLQFANLAQDNHYGEFFNEVKFKEGKFGNAAYFNGVDTYGNCNLNIPEYNITIEFWFKTSTPQTSVIVSAHGMNNSHISLSNK